MSNGRNKFKSFVENTLHVMYVFSKPRKTISKTLYQTHELRLKAFRRGEQDVEHLTLLAGKKDWDRQAVARAVAGALDLSAETRQQYEEDAGALRFAGVTDSHLEQLRLRVAAALAR